MSSLILLLLLNLLVKPLWIFGIDLTVQNRVGASEYGFYAAVFSFTLIFNIVLDFGLTHFNNRAIAQDRVQIARNFSQITGIKLILGLLYFLVSICIGYLLGYTSAHFALLMVLTANQFLASFILFLRSHLSGLHLFKSDSILSVLDKLLMIITCGLLLYTSVLSAEFTIMHFVWAQFVSYVIAAVVGFVMVLQKAKIFVFKIDLESFKKNLHKSLPFALLILLMALYTRVDSIMIQQLSGSFENGIYFQAFRLLDVFNQVGYLFAVLLLPMFSSMLAKKEAVSNLSRLAFSLIWVGVLAIGTPLWLSASEVMDYLYVNHSELSTPVFQILIISSLAFGSTYVFGTLLTAAGNLKALNSVALSGFLLNVVLNFIMIPHYGANGAAIATVFTQFVTAIAQIVLSFKLADLSFGLSYWWRLVICTILTFLLSYLMWLTGLHPVVFIVFSTVGSLGSAMLFGIINVRAAIELIQSRIRKPDLG